MAKCHQRRNRKKHIRRTEARQAERKRRQKIFGRAIAPHIMQYAEPLSTFHLSKPQLVAQKGKGIAG